MDVLRPGPGAGLTHFQGCFSLVSAVMREQFGVLLEEEAPPGATLPVPVRPGCQLCKRTQLAVTMHKIV